MVLLLAQGQRLDDGSPAEVAEGTRLARRAVELGRDDAVALTRGGHALAHLTGDLDGGIALLDRAIVLNPNLASAWFLGGYLRVWHGESDGAIEHFERAMRLSPLDPETYRMQAGIAMAHLFAGRFDAASSWAEKAHGNLPSFLMVVSIIAASHALAGRADHAQRAMDHLRRARSGAAHLQSRRIGCRSTGRKISPPSRMACGERDCRNEGPTRVFATPAGSSLFEGIPAWIWVYTRPREPVLPSAELRRGSLRRRAILAAADLHRVSQEAVLDGDNEAVAS